MEGYCTDVGWSDEYFVLLSRVKREIHRQAWGGLEEVRSCRQSNRSIIDVLYGEGRYSG